MDDETLVKVAKRAATEDVSVPAEAVVSFDEFVTRTGLSAVWADGLQVYLAGEIYPRSMSAWQTQLSAFQSLA